MSSISHFMMAKASPEKSTALCINCKCDNNYWLVTGASEAPDLTRCSNARRNLKSRNDSLVIGHAASVAEAVYDSPADRIEMGNEKLGQTLIKKFSENRSARVVSFLADF